MTITLPDAMRAELEAKANALGFASVQEYVMDLIESDEHSEAPTPQELGFASQEELEAKLLASLNSGPPIPVTPEFWADLDKEVEERVAARRRQA